MEKFEICIYRLRPVQADYAPRNLQIRMQKIKLHRFMSNSEKRSQKCWENFEKNEVWLELQITFNIRSFSKMSQFLHKLGKWLQPKICIETEKLCWVRCIQKNIARRFILNMKHHEAYVQLNMLKKSV